MALIIFSFLPETPKSSLCVTFCYMAILNFQYNQLDMLYFSILLHHRRVGVEIVNCAHGVLSRSLILNGCDFVVFVVITWMRHNNGDGQVRETDESAPRDPDSSCRGGGVPSQWLNHRHAIVFMHYVRRRCCSAFWPQTSLRQRLVVASRKAIYLLLLIRQTF